MLPHPDSPFVPNRDRRIFAGHGLAETMPAPADPVLAWHTTPKPPQVSAGAKVLDMIAEGLGVKRK